MARTSYFSLAIVLLILDRLTKWWVFSTLDPNVPNNLIGNAIRLTRVHNDGGAFGLFPGGGVVFLVVSGIVSLMLFLILLTLHIDSRLIKTGMAFVLAGAIGNLIDRIQWGYVLDFFEIRGFPIFNVADSCITVGAVFIILAILFGGDRNRSARKADRV
ncbi:MAG: signal peptidase II [Candidatus Atribacteria bacterium]|nr:MAG: signal peptidase II [Candidatus Atribacteria bacterium]